MFPDTLQAESFAPTTPARLPIWMLAKTGVRFEQAHVQHTQCTPSRVAMLTGRYMHVLGHRTNPPDPAYEFNYSARSRRADITQYYGKNDAFSADAMNLSVSEWSPDGVFRQQRIQVWRGGILFR